MTLERILITGAAGEIGGTLREGLRGAYRLLKLSDVRPLAPARPGEETVQADLCDAAAVASLMEDVDCVVHLGGVPREGAWEAILHNNIEGTYNVFEAARARARRSPGDAPQLGELRDRVRRARRRS